MWQLLSFLPGLYHLPSPSPSTTLFHWEHLKSILFPSQLLGSGNPLEFPREDAAEASVKRLICSSSLDRVGHLDLAPAKLRSVPPDAAVMAPLLPLPLIPDPLLELPPSTALSLCQIPPNACCPVPPSHLEMGLEHITGKCQSPSTARSLLQQDAGCSSSCLLH